MSHRRCGIAGSALGVTEAFRRFQYPSPPFVVSPAETIEAHRAFIARRRSARPSEEYRIPTEEEWDAFLAHFEKRKVSIGTCARVFGTHAFMSTLASDARSSDLTPPNGHGLPRSATT